MTRVSICVALILTGLFTTGSATTLTVKQNDSSAFTLIQSAIDAAEDGDEIIVHPGQYIENIEFNGKNIILRSTDPLDWSVVEQTIIDGRATSDSVVNFSGSEGTTCVLSGFTITHGYAVYVYGEGITGAGGIDGGDPGCFATIEHNRITSNTSDGSWIYYGTFPYGSHRWEGGWGGGIYGCHGLIQYNIITENSSKVGGGGLAVCNGVIQYNDILENVTVKAGGGIGGCSGTISNNMIHLNIAGWGGGMHGCSGTISYNRITSNTARGGGGMSSCEGNIFNCIIAYNLAIDITGGGIVDGGGNMENCIIFNNYSDNGGGGVVNFVGVMKNCTITSNTGIVVGGGLVNCDGIIKNNIIWGNFGDVDPQIHIDPYTREPTTPTFSCIQDWDGGGDGNITSDPLFINPENGDFRLRPDSPCIDAGASVTLAFDFDGNPRPFDAVSEPRGDGSNYDIGAFEYVVLEQVLRDYLLGKYSNLTETYIKTLDRNQDGRIDVADILFLLRE